MTFDKQSNGRRIEVDRMSGTVRWLMQSVVESFTRTEITPIFTCPRSSGFIPHASTPIPANVPSPFHHRCCRRQSTFNEYVSLMFFRTSKLALEFSLSWERLSTYFSSSTGCAATMCLHFCLTFLPSPRESRKLDFNSRGFSRGIRRFL